MNYKTIGSISREITYISGPEGIIGFQEVKNGEKNFYYIHTDHLGSLENITNGEGVPVEGEEQSFDAWGRRRDPKTWSFLGSKEGMNEKFSYKLDRGYTGHEHYDQFGVIDMNGRVYDPMLGRMLSPDAVVKVPRPLIMIDIPMSRIIH